MGQEKTQMAAVLGLILALCFLIGGIVAYVTGQWEWALGPVAFIPFFLRLLFPKTQTTDSSQSSSVPSHLSPGVAQEPAVIDAKQKARRKTNEADDAFLHATSEREVAEPQGDDLTDDLTKASQ